MSCRSVRMRERVSVGSSSTASSSGEGSTPGGAGGGVGGAGGSGGRYESDRSYKPRYSTDDDKPLTTFRLLVIFNQIITTFSVHHHNNISLLCNRQRTEEDGEQPGPSGTSSRGGAGRQTNGHARVRHTYILHTNLLCPDTSGLCDIL